MGETRLRHAMDAMDAASSGCGSVELSRTGLGTFGRKGDFTLRLCLAPNAVLEGLAAHLREELARRDVPFDRKRLLPHITLARRARISERALDGLPFPAADRAEHVTLFKSTLSPDGAEYKPLYAVALEG